MIEKIFEGFTVTAILVAALLALTIGYKNSSKEPEIIPICETEHYLRSVWVQDCIENSVGLLGSDIQGCYNVSGKLFCYPEKEIKPNDDSEPTTPKHK